MTDPVPTILDGGTKALLAALVLAVIALAGVVVFLFRALSAEKDARLTDTRGLTPVVQSNTEALRALTERIDKWAGRR